VDDDADIRLALEMLLAYEGYEVWTAGSARAALARLDEEAGRGRLCGAVVTDVKMPGMDGLELLAILEARDDAPPVVVVSGHADVEMAVGACRQGAVDFLEKPLDQSRVLVSVAGALERGRLERANRTLRTELGSRFDPVGASASWRAVLDDAKRAADADVPVLVTGENGTGKEVVARHLHLSGPRARGPFVAVNCAAIPDELIESELFGHERGSFTGAHEARIGHFEAAHTGVLFLDEIGDMPLGAQAALLRALESREIRRVGGSASIPVDINVVAATNTDLAAAVDAGTFRTDLLFRLSVVTLHVPALRERPQDVEPLARHFLEAIGRRLGRRPPTLEPGAVERLAKHPFPGNVRELRNAIEAAHVFADGDALTADDIERVLARGPLLGANTHRKRAVDENGDDPFDAETFEAFKERSEALFIARKLAANDGNVKRTAEELGMQRSHLYKKLDRYGLR
jgi:two-component system, NtrC family, nitrogen regulation response regulator NtrX